MSPHPASPPPTPPQGPLRRWGPMSSTPARETPPPPKPPTSMNSGPPPPPMPHQISEARARLRSTGKTLDELDSGREIYTGRVRNDSYNYSQNSGSGPTFTPPVSPTSPTSFNTGYTNGRYQSLAPEENSYLTNVGRSQSFHTSNLQRNDSRSQYNKNVNGHEWQPRSRSPQPSAPPRQGKNKPFSGHFSTLQNTKKDYNQWSRKREENLDDSFQMPKFENSTEKWRDQQNYSRYSREHINDRPKSSMENGYESRNSDFPKHGSTQFSAKMAGKFSQPRSVMDPTALNSSEGDAPIPPPRTKRRQRPQTTYYFGQPTLSSSAKQRPASIYANMSFNTSPAAKNDYIANGTFDSHSNNRSHLNKSTSFLNNQNRIENENGYNNNYATNNSSRSRSESHNIRYDDNQAMNRKNERYNTRDLSSGRDYSNDREYANGYDRSNGRDYSNERQHTNGRDYSNERYDSGYGERQETYGRQQEHHYSRNDNRSGRRLSDGKRSDEKSNRKTSDERRRISKKVSRDENRRNSPIVERRFKTTKTVTPVFVMETKQPKQYRSMDVLSSTPDRNSLWTQTLESKKKASNDYMRTSSTLPRKVHQPNLSMSSKTYIYGTDSKRDKIRNYNSGSIINVSQNGCGSPNQAPTNGNSGKHVLRSHSLNVRPVTNLSSLRSPNLIASIARTSSTRRPETQSSEDIPSRNLYEQISRENSYHRPSSPPNGKSEDKKSRFMEGLLNTAPELFHFIHGEGDDTVDNKQNDDSPPRLIRPPGSVSPSPGPLNAPKVFTFGREGGNTLRIGSSGSGNDINASNPTINKTAYSTNSMSRNSSGYDSGTYSTNSIKRTGSTVNDASNRRQSTFNMKTHGGSLLYSPSFRERSQQMQQEKERMKLDAEMAGKRAGLSTGLPRENAPILIQVRDWNNAR